MPSEGERLQQEMWAEAGPETPQRTPEEERVEPRLKRVNRNQLLLRTVDVEQLVEPDHVVRAIWELVGRLDLNRFTAEIEAVEGMAGRPALDPHLLISLWIYAYSEGLSSARGGGRVPPCLAEGQNRPAAVSRARLAESAL